MATVVGKLFPIISAPSALDLTGTFFLFSGFCLVGTTVMYFYLPETANATLEEVDVVFAEHKPKLVRPFWREAQKISKLDRAISESFTAGQQAAIGAAMGAAMSKSSSTQSLSVTVDVPDAAA